MRTSLLILSLFWGFIVSAVPIQELNNQLIDAARDGNIDLGSLFDRFLALVDRFTRAIIINIRHCIGLFKTDRVHAARFLVRAGGSIDDRGRFKKTPLHVTIDNDRLDAVRSSLNPVHRLTYAPKSKKRHFIGLHNLFT